MSTGSGSVTNARSVLFRRGICVNTVTSVHSVALYGLLTKRACGAPITPKTCDSTNSGTKHTHG